MVKFYVYVYGSVVNKRFSRRVEYYSNQFLAATG